MENIVINKINLKKEILKDLSQEAIDFMKKALKKNHEKRYTAEQLLNHSWFYKMNKTDIPPLNKQYRYRILLNLKNFSKAN